MFVNHQISSKSSQASLIFLLLCHTNWVSSSKDVYWGKHKLPSQNPLQLQTFTHTFLRNETTGESQSDSFQYQRSLFDVAKMALTTNERKHYNSKKTKEKSDGIGLQNYDKELTYSHPFHIGNDSTSCSLAETRATIGDDHQQRMENKRHSSTYKNTLPFTDIAYSRPNSHSTVPILPGKENNSKAMSHERREKERENMKKEATVPKNGTININSGSLHSLGTTDVLSSSMSPSSSPLSLLIAQKTWLMQLDAFPQPVPSSVASTGQIEEESQVEKLLQSDESLIKSKIKSANSVNMENHIKRVAAPTPTTPSLAGLFIASKSKQHFDNGKFHFKRRSSSSQKSIGNIIMSADKHSGGRGDTKVEPNNAGEYLSKGNEKQEGEKIKNGEYAVNFSRDVNKDTDFPALSNGASSSVIRERRNKSFARNNNGNNASGSTQLMDPITKTTQGKVGQKENQNFNTTTTVDVTIEKEKRKLDHYPSFPSSFHQSGDQQSIRDVKHGTTAGGWSGSRNDGKIIKYVVTSSIGNETQGKIAKGLPTSEAVVETASPELVFPLAKVVKAAGVLETISGANNIHLQPGTNTTTTGSSSTTRNCSTASGKQARFPDRKGTIEVTPSKENSYERNKSNVVNVNDDLTWRISLRCKCKRQTKHGFHFPNLNNLPGKQALNSFNRTITAATSPCKSTVISPIDTTTTTAAYTTQKNQLAELDTFPRASSFELEKVVVGTQSADSISTFDNPFDKTDQTISITSKVKKGRNEHLSRPSLSHQPHHHLELAYKRTGSGFDGNVKGTEEWSSGFLGNKNKSYKRLRRDANSKNNLFKNFIRHHRNVWETGKGTMARFLMPTNNPAQQFPQIIIKEPVIEAPNARRTKKSLSSFVVPLDFSQSKGEIEEENLDLPFTNTTNYSLPGNLKNSEKTTTAGLLLKHNGLISVGASNGFPHHHDSSSSDAYRLQLEGTKSAAATTHISLEAQRRKRGMSEKISKFIEQTRNNRESNGRANSSSMSVVFMPTTTTTTGVVRVKRLSSSSTFPSAKKVAYMSRRGIDKSNGARARSSNSRKLNFTDEKKTAQGEEILDRNRIFSARSFSVNGKERNRDNQTRRVGTRGLIIGTTTPTTTWRNEAAHGYDSRSSDHVSTIMSSSGSGGNIGQNLMDTFPSAQSETKAQLPQWPPPQQRENMSIPNDSSEARVKTTFTTARFKGNEREEFGRKSKKNMDCTSTTAVSPSNAAMADDGCGRGESGGRRALSRKLIPLKENLLALNFLETSDERVVSPVMNANNKNNNNNTHDDIKSKEAIYYQVDREDVGASLHASPNSPTAKNTRISSIYRSGGESRSQNGKITGKIADVSDKVWGGKHNFVQKQWMSDMVNGWRSTDNHSNESNESTRAKLIPNSSNNVLSSVTTTSGSNGSSKQSETQKTFHFDAFASQGHDSNTARHLVNMLSVKNMPKFRERSLIIKEPSMVTIVYSPSIQLHGDSTVKREQNSASQADDGDDNAFPTPLSLTTPIYGESTKGAFYTNTINADALRRNENMNSDTTPTVAASSSRNYDFDSSALTSYVRTILPILPYSSSSATKSYNEPAEVNSINTFTTEASTSSGSEEVKATNGFIHEKTLSSTQGFTTTLLIEESKTEEGEPATPTFLSTTLRQAAFADTATTPATEIEFSTNIGTTIASETNKQQEDTPEISDENVSLVTVTTSAASKESASSVVMQFAESDISPTISPSEATTFFAPTSQKQWSPTDIPSTTVMHDVGKTSQPQGITLMSTHAANLEDAKISPTTSPVLSVSTTTVTAVAEENGNVEMASGDGSLVPTTVTTTLVPLPATTNIPEGEENIKETESTSAADPVHDCDHSKGLVYSEETKNCVCRSGLFHNHNEDKCSSLVGNECFGGGSETSSSDCPLNSHCKPQETSGEGKSICTCIPGYIPTVDKSRCMAGWSTDCSSTTLSDISIKNHCHPDFDCISKDQEAGGKCACKDNTTIGLPHSLEGNGSGAGSLKWNVQQIKCFLDYGSDCNPLNDKCNDFRFLKCSRQNAKCECADSNNQLYDERIRECVARAGTFCTVTPTEDDNSGAGSHHYDMTEDVRLLACIGNSTCVRMGNETSSRLSGTCKCFDGYDQHWQGYCTMKGSSAFRSKQCNGVLGFLALTLLMLINL